MFRYTVSYDLRSRDRNWGGKREKRRNQPVDGGTAGDILPEESRDIGSRVCPWWSEMKLALFFFC